MSKGLEGPMTPQSRAGPSLHAILRKYNHILIGTRHWTLPTHASPFVLPHIRDLNLCPCKHIDGIHLVTFSADFLMTVVICYLA